jgi:phosphomannomutase
MIESVFKAYDIRATYPEPLNEDVAWRVGFATCSSGLRQMVTTTP